MPRTYVSEMDTPYYYASPRQRRIEPSCCRKIASFICCVLNYALCGLILTVAGVVVWNHLGRPQTRQEVLDILGKYNVSDFLHVLDELTEADWKSGLNEDPYAGKSGGMRNATLDVWAGTDGRSGLTLTLQNALDDNWQTEFAAAVGDWQESEALTLTTVQVDVDNSCAKVQGLMKVCNGNFGATGWVGVNEVEMQYSSSNDPGVIVSSVAKMNEYYLQHASYDHRQYTMCHEIGHGFGLPHTDENPYNSDQGNCLDYTNTPANNLHPGTVNFNRLKKMYINGGTDYDDNDDYMKNNDDVGEQGGRYLRKIRFRDQHRRGKTFPRRVILKHYLYA